MNYLKFCLILLLFPQNSFSQNLYFPPLSGTNWDTLSPQSLGWCQNRIDSLYDFLEMKNTKSFILLKDGKIVLEQYFGTHTQNDLWYWASAGKTITAFMTGIAQQENYLSISDTTSTYLGQGWTSCTPQQEEKITIRNQLTMTSGLDDGVPDLYCTDDTCLVYLTDAGTRWAYHNGPYTLLDQVIENATGSALNTYVNQKLSAPTGMAGGFLQIGYNNVFFSTARSMARFGLLMLNRGNWNGNQVMTDTTYFDEMISTSQTLNLAYGYLWWLNGKSTFMVPGLQFQIPGYLNPAAPADMYAAMGKNGQFLNVSPSQNLVWLRMGDAPDSTDVPFLLNNEIWQYLNELDCSGVGLSDYSSNTNNISIHPNPTKNNFTLKSETPFWKVIILSATGQQMQTHELNEQNEFSCSVSDLSPGFYIIRVYHANGTTSHSKIIIKN